MATFVDISGAEYASERNGKAVPVLVGKSFMPLLQGKNNPIHEQPIFWEHEGNKAVRLGSYKAVMKWEQGKPEKWELYDMEKDRTEIHDLSADKPNVLRELTTAWKEWADAHQVEPWEQMLDSLKNNREKARAARGK